MAKFLMIITLIIPSVMVQAQPSCTISGFVMDDQQIPLAYASVGLFSEADSSLRIGTISDSTGWFELAENQPGQYYVTISFIGYESGSISFEAQSPGQVDLGSFYLKETSFEISEAEVVTERRKARQHTDRTTYYVNQKMRKASSTGMDMITHVPGISVDLQQNISMEGRKNVLIMVNGIERDASFLNQLDSDQIDRIETSAHPGSNYRSGISAVINIITKTDIKNGISGHIYAEVPLTKEVYAFPSASLNYTHKKMNLYASYNGEFSYFDIEAGNTRNILAEGYTSRISKTQILRQKQWSHKFHYGLDYLINNKNQLAVYGFTNLYSNEHDGAILINEFRGDSLIQNQDYHKEDMDRNRSTYASVFFRHLFDQPGKDLTFNARYYNLSGSNSIFYRDKPSGNSQVHNTAPVQKTLEAALDFNIPLSFGFQLKTGLNERISLLQDKYWPAFAYREMITAGYASLAYEGKKVQFNGGLRGELAQQNSQDAFAKTIFTVLPNAAIKYKLSKNSNLRLSYHKNIQRPHIYQLNPNIHRVDPYTTQQGNQSLNSALHNEVSLEYSGLLKNNFLTAGIFYSSTRDYIETITTLNESFHFEQKIQNSGAISRYGIKLLGSLKPHKNISINPYVNLHYVQADANEFTRTLGVASHGMIALQSSVSMTVLMKHDLALSAMLNYNGSVVNVQGHHFEDVLYLLSLEKTFFVKFKFGISTAIPFKKEFTYRGYQLQGSGFNEYSEDNIHASLLPVWLKFKYSFSSGKKVDRIKRSDDFKEARSDKGF